MLLSIAAFIGSALAIGLFYHAWQSNQIVFKRIAKLGALALMFGALMLWVEQYGPELGTCYAVVAFSLQAWSWIYFARQRIDKDIKRVSLPFVGGLTQPRFAVCVNALIKAAACVGLSAVCAMLVTVVWTTTLSMSKVNQIALGIYTMPILWGAAAYWLCADSKLWRPVCVLSGLSGLSYLFIYSV
ncbi:hypothetical protein N7931_00010 [Catenovulum sp. 2E275]|uniref:hypothetical protein n=1 Tax=Catenovulum sp. 2E275 TaxID=2980497 RepID=UPI0021D1198A|nr:hypothetical protein [Catenovulum sp. 2E275]MCU4674003.1 hypothetical protein [Catenovulum sp. 2E275]